MRLLDLVRVMGFGLILLIPLLPVLFIIVLSFLFKKRRTYKSLLPKTENEGKMEKINNSSYRDALISVEIVILIGLAVLLTKTFWVAVLLGLMVLILVEMGNLKLRRKLRENDVKIEHNPSIEKADKEIAKGTTIMAVIVLVLSIITPFIFLALVILAIAHTSG